MTSTVAIRTSVRRLRANPYLLGGIMLLVAVFLFGFVGPLLIDAAWAEVGAFAPKLTPSIEHWLGTDTQGRDILAVLILATPKTLIIGLVAGTIGVTVGVILGLLSGYFGGKTDTVVRVLTDVYAPDQAPGFHRSGRSLSEWPGFVTVA